MANLNRIGGIHYDMMRRCYNEKAIAYKDYGGKGIEVCEEWHNRDKFKKWAAANGYVKGLRLIRKNSNENYEPTNCYFGNTSQAKYGKNQETRHRARRNKLLKEKLGLTKYSDTRLSHILGHIISRCYCPTDKAYCFYGGRGIRVCDEWRIKDGGVGRYNFIKWAYENGWKELDDPKIQTVDRIDPDGDYCPENCRFISLSEQQRNKRKRMEKNNRII